MEIYSAFQYESVILSAALAVLKRLKISSAYAEIEILSEEEIKELNKRERNLDEVTDVLSFPSAEIKLPFKKSDYKEDINPENGKILLGEIFICLKRAEEQAAEYGHSLERELSFLTVHGMLHLLGFDHDTTEREEKMTKLQKEILSFVGER
jgi:metalloprotein, YbeY/UPF0054 family